MASEKDKMNSSDLYKRTLVRMVEDFSFDGRAAVNVLIARMADELLREKQSALLNTCMFALGSRENRFTGSIYHFNHFDLDLRKQPGVLSPADASTLIRCLADYVSDGRIINNAIYDGWYESFGIYGTNAMINSQRAYYLIQMIDQYLEDFEKRLPEVRNIPASDENDQKETAQEKETEKISESSHFPE